MRFHDLPQCMRLCVFQFCSAKDIRKTISCVSTQCWNDCWHAAAIVRGPKVTLICKSVGDITNGLAVLQAGRHRYEGRLQTLIIEIWLAREKNAEEWEANTLQVRQLCLTGRFWFERLEIHNVYRCRDAIAGRLALFLCSGALPNLRDLSLRSCRLSNEPFRGLIRNTPLVEVFSGHSISIESLSYSGEELCLWPNLRALKLCYALIFDISPEGNSAGFLSSVASNLKQVVLVDVNFTMGGIGLGTGDIRDMYMKFVLSAPKLSRCVILENSSGRLYLSKENQERLRLERPELNFNS